MMVIEFVLALLLGLIAGTITGLIPGIHINLLAVILISSLSYFSQFPLISLAVFITSLAITHTFIDFIPSVFLGAPDEDTFLSVLPGHQMIKRGLAHEAIVLTLYGSLSALVVILLFAPVFIFLAPFFFEKLKFILAFILIFISAYLVLREEKIMLSMAVFLLAGFLGFTSLSLPIQQPLLPLLTGLFGVSSILISIKNKTKIPKQEIKPVTKIRIPKKEYAKSMIGSIISAPMSSFLPGIGSGHAAVIGSELIPQSKKGFLVLLGSINTIVIGLSFITLFSIGKTRTGAAVAISEILKTITLTHLTTIILTIILSGACAFFIAINLSKIASQKINQINYTKLSISIILVLLMVNIIFSNFLGFILLITSTALGVFTILSGARRINLMGSLLMPTIIFYLFL